MVRINQILSEVNQLNKEEQFDLLKRLVFLISKKESATGNVRLSAISGVGADVWANIDIDRYIETEREW